MAPDSLIYHLYQQTAGGPFLVGSLSNTDTVASFVNYTPQAFSGPQNFAGTQFPSFAPSDTLNIIVTFIPDGFCANAPTAFFPTVIPGADSLQWNFGDGSGSSDWSPVYTYTAGGSYTVSVTAFLNGQIATSSQPITITDLLRALAVIPALRRQRSLFRYPEMKRCTISLQLRKCTAQVLTNCGTPYSI
jgi:hypothetical protein